MPTQLLIHGLNTHTFYIFIFYDTQLQIQKSKPVMIKLSHTTLAQTTVFTPRRFDKLTRFAHIVIVTENGTKPKHRIINEMIFWTDLATVTPTAHEPRTETRKHYKHTRVHVRKGQRI